MAKEDVLKFKFDIRESNINPLFIEALLNIAKDEIIIEKVITKSENITQFTNCLISALICILDREKRNSEMIKGLIDANPQIKEILKAKNEVINKDKINENN